MAPFQFSSVRRRSSNSEEVFRRRVAVVSSVAVVASVAAAVGTVDGAKSCFSYYTRKIEELVAKEDYHEHHSKLRNDNSDHLL